MWFRSFFNSRTSRSAHSRPSGRLRVEQLEDRVVPASHIWTGAVNDLWSEPGNWDGGVPMNEEADGALVRFTGNTSSVMDIVGLRVASFDFSGTNNTVALSAPLGIHLSSLIVSDGGTHTITGAALDLPDGLSVSVREGSTLNIVSSISPKDGIGKFGVGTLSIQGTQTYTARTSVIAGALEIPAGSSLTKSQVVLDNGGTLTGGGTVASVSADNTVDAGIKLLAPGRGASTQTLTIGTGDFGALTYQPTIAGRSSDRINLIGTLDLTGAALDVRAIQPATAASYTLIDNSGTDAITGTFNGLPEGEAVFVGAQAYIISYVGGTGNDVVLTRAGDPPAPQPSLPSTPSTPAPAPFYSGAQVVGNILILSGLGVRDGVQLVAVPLGSAALFTDVTSDGSGDVLLFLPNATMVIDGRSGRPLGLGADDNGDGFRDLMIFNPDGSMTRTDGRTGIALVL